jgi:15-cis-phytoene desaturase
MEDVIIVGSGLAGLSTAMELMNAGRRVTMLEKQRFVGGRTADWDDDGMHVESGLHRWLGFYKELPALVEKAGIEMDSVVIWEDKLEIRMPDGGPSGTLTLGPVVKPVRTFASLLDNNQLISPADKASLIYFFSSGLVDYNLSRTALDHNSVEQYARKKGVTEDALNRVLIPLTEGIFFLPPPRYSAMILMGLLVPALKRPHTIRVGSFSGGMSEVMCRPIAEHLVGRGMDLRLETTVESLMVEDGRVVGVVAGGEPIRAAHVVVATSIGPAQRLVREHFADHSWFEGFMKLPSMPSVTLQMELSEPALPYDHVIFSPHTLWASYAEQCRTTFRQLPGRLSIDLGQPEVLLDLPHEEVYRRAMADAPRVGLGDLESKVSRYRVVSHPADFYLLSPGTEALRPPQATAVPGLTLAGDYTSQPLFCSMEGAVISGRRATKAVLAALEGENPLRTIEEEVLYMEDEVAMQETE